MNRRLEKADSAEEEDLGLPPVEVDPRILEAASRNFVSNPDQPSSSEPEISLNQPPPPSIPSRGPATPQVSASSSVPTVAEASIEDPNSLNANNNQNGGGDAIPIVHAMAVMDPDPNNNNYGGSMNAQHQQETSQQVIVEPSPLESSIAVPAGAAAAPAQPHPYAQQESPLPPLMIQQTPPPQQQQDVRKSGCVIFSLTSALVCMCCLLPIICILIFVGLDWEDVSFDDDDQYATDDFFNTNFFDEDSTD